MIWILDAKHARSENQPVSCWEQLTRTLIIDFFLTLVGKCGNFVNIREKVLVRDFTWWLSHDKNLIEAGILCTSHYICIIFKLVLFINFIILNGYFGVEQLFHALSISFNVRVWKLIFFIIPPETKFGGYIGFSLSVCMDKLLPLSDWLEILYTCSPQCVNINT